MHSWVHPRFDDKNITTFNGKANRLGWSRELQRVRSFNVLVQLVRQPQYPFGIGGGVSGDDLRFFTPQFGQRGNHLGEVFR